MLPCTIAFTTITHIPSVNSTTCDGAREILEKPDDEPRWNAIHHYYMEQEDKEEAKRILGFSMVPFYVFLNENGEIVQKGGGNAVDFERIPGVEQEVAVASGEREVVINEVF